MKDKNILIYNTEIAAYLLWEYTQHPNPIDLWYCAEDIAFFFEYNYILSRVNLERILASSRFDLFYISFVRQLSFKIFNHTKNKDEIFNWYATENLLNDIEWCNSIIKIACVYRSIRNNDLASDLIRTERIKNHLSFQRLEALNDRKNNSIFSI